MHTTEITGLFVAVDAQTMRNRVERQARVRLLSVIDLHTHILPGLDDGARDIDQSLAMARSMAEDGVRIVAATPHVRADYKTTPEAMRAALARVRAAVAQAGIDIDIREGGEIALDQLEFLPPSELVRFGLGGNPKLLLVEYPYHDRPLSLARECARLREAGITPLIAHPERNPIIQSRPSYVDELVRAGAYIQLTAASVDGRLGKKAEGCARQLLELELAHVVASDAHAPGIREAGLSGACRSVGGGELANWLTSAVPAALLEGHEPPGRPSGQLRRRSLGRIRR